MKEFISTYVYAIDGQQLTENGKNVGKMVIVPGEYDGERFGNVGITVPHEEYVADEGKVFQKKDDETVKVHVIVKDAVDQYDEVDDESLKDRVRPEA